MGAYVQEAYNEEAQRQRRHKVLKASRNNDVKKRLDVMQEQCKSLDDSIRAAEEVIEAIRKKKTEILEEIKFIREHYQEDGRKPFSAMKPDHDRRVSLPGAISEPRETSIEMNSLEKS